MSTEKNGFTFAFPEVVRAYKTSFHRKLSSNVLGAILGRSLLVAIASGIGVYLLHVGTQLLLNYMLKMGSLCYGLLGVIIYPLIVGFGGMIMGNTVGKSSVEAKFPDTQTVGKLALVIGLVGYLTYLTMYILFFNAPERFDHWFDYLRQAFYLFLFVGLAAAGSVAKVEETPFCENCNEFMKLDRIGNSNFDGTGYGFDITKESAILEILDSKAFENLCELGNDWVHNKHSAINNFCIVEIWQCPNCNKNGYVNGLTIQSREGVNSNGQITWKSESQRIHSSHVDGEEIQILMRAKQVLGTPLGAITKA